MRNCLAMILISFENVAENRSVWRLVGMYFITFLMSLMNPMSSMRSASSRTRISILLRSQAFCWQRSSRRPGVATSMSIPALSLLICGLIPTPPKTTRLLKSIWLLYSSILVLI